jgi:hypothetical protein
VRPVLVVVDPPFSDDAACRGHATEQVLVEALVPEAAVQALDEAVLDGLAGRDVVPLDADVLLPKQDRPRRQFGAVVGGPGLDPGSSAAARASTMACG